ncbi:hypothetical protein ACWEKR_24305 [Nocardia sp. NPDC004573]
MEYPWAGSAPIPAESITAHMPDIPLGLPSDHAIRRRAWAETVRAADPASIDSPSPPMLGHT